MYFKDQDFQTLEKNVAAARCAKAASVTILSPASHFTSSAVCLGECQGFVHSSIFQKIICNLFFLLCSCVTLKFKHLSICFRSFSTRQTLVTVPLLNRAEISMRFCLAVLLPEARGK